MKKQLLILAVAATALAACTNDETVEVNKGEAISFRTLVSGVTRNTAGPMQGTAFAVGDVFNVYADFYDADATGTKNSKYFQDNFTKQSAGGFTATNKQYYWPAFASDDKLTFTAIYGGTQVAGTPGKVEGFTPTAIASGADAGKMMDLMVARKEYTASGGSTPVVLNFRHALSQIVVKVKNSNASLDFDITGVRIGFLSTKGDFNYDYNYSTSAADAGGVTTTQEVTADASVGDITSGVTLVKSTNWSRTAVTDANTNKYEQTWTAQPLTGAQNATALTSFKPWLLIPQTQTAFTAYTSGTQVTPASANPVVNGCYIALKLAVYNYNGSARSNQLVAEQWCYWPIAPTWNPGYKYTYTVDLAGGGYQPGNVDTTEETTLDPVLGDVIVFSPDCTVDYWVVAAESNVTMP